MAALQESAATDGYASYGGYDAYSPEAKSTDSVGYAWCSFYAWSKCLEVSYICTWDIISQHFWPGRRRHWTNNVTRCTLIIPLIRQDLKPYIEYLQTNNKMSETEGRNTTVWNSDYEYSRKYLESKFSWFLSQLIDTHFCYIHKNCNVRVPYVIHGKIAVQVTWRQKKRPENSVFGWIGQIN